MAIPPGWPPYAEPPRTLTAARHRTTLPPTRDAVEFPILSAFRRRRFFRGRTVEGSGCKDVVWFNPLGKEMSDEEWRQPFARCLGLALAGRTLDELDEQGRPVHDDNFLMLLNAHHEAIPFVLPQCVPGMRWELVLDTGSPPCMPAPRADGEGQGPPLQTEQGVEAQAPPRFAPGESYALGSRTMALLAQPAEAASERTEG
jgi:hypothetical protein